MTGSVSRKFPDVMVEPVERARRTRAGAVACAVLLAVAACGGEPDSSTPDETEPRSAPALPAPLAEELARASDDVAGLLEAGDGCGAAARADELRDRAIAAVDEGEVPRALAEPLIAAVERVSALTSCEVEDDADEAEKGDERDGNGEGKGNDKGKGKGKEKEKKDDGDGEEGDG